MRKHTTTPPSFVIFALAGGLLFILGGIITAMSPNARFVLVASAIAFLLLGAYTVVVVVRHNSLITEFDELERELAAARSADAGLRVRLGYTLREPLITVVGLAEGLLTTPEMPSDERMSTLAEIRNNAREVEQVLGDLAAEKHFANRHPHTEGIVLLHEEVRSIASTPARSTPFVADLRPARAWGDSAAVRQVLRTVIGAAAGSGSPTIELATDQRSNRATTTISGRGRILEDEAVTALTGGVGEVGSQSAEIIALREARDVVEDMGGTIGFAEALGKSYVVIEFEAADEAFGLRAPSPMPMTSPQPRLPEPPADRPDLTFAATMDLRPERPTAAIRFT